MPSERSTPVPEPGGLENIESVGLRGGRGQTGRISVPLRIGGLGSQNTVRQVLVGPVKVRYVGCSRQLDQGWWFGVRCLGQRLNRMLGGGIRRGVVAGLRGGTVIGAKGGSADSLPGGSTMATLAMRSSGKAAEFPAGAGDGVKLDRSVGGAGRPG